MTGAEIVGACREAAMEALRDAQKSGGRLAQVSIQVKQEYLEEKLKSTKPLLSNHGVLEEFLKFENSRGRL
jgi:SpoVK/Ycf46/Vps4 family AAA+-type ATPase